MTHADNHPRAVFAPDLNVICANFAKLPKKPGNLGNQGNHSKKPLSSNDLSGTHPVTQAANGWVTGVTGLPPRRLWPRRERGFAGRRLGAPPDASTDAPATTVPPAHSHAHSAQERP